MNAPGSMGYAEGAAAFVERYERVPPVEKYRPVLHLLPKAPCRALDVGAGSGVDAAWLASLGHDVVAVEPTDELRRRAMTLHKSPRIRWMDDCLPRLDSVAALRPPFQLILVAGVWTHLDEAQQRTSPPTLALMPARDGLLVISVRRGPAAGGRLAFPVSIPDTVAHGEAAGLRLTIQAEMPSLQPANRAAGVTWTWLAFSPSTAGSADRPGDR